MLYTNAGGSCHLIILRISQRATLVWTSFIPTSSFVSLAPSMNASSMPSFSTDLAYPCSYSNSISPSVRKRRIHEGK